MSSARDTFARDSAGYRLARPRYPQALYHWLASLCEERKTAWDCATGNGQAAVDLAAYFETVIATDRSAEQLAHAEQQPGISYRVADASRSGIADGSVDLVTVAQALHWFDFRSFWPEVRRVAKANGVFAAWGYSGFSVSPDFDAAVLAPLQPIVRRFWAPDNTILWNGYRDADILFPFEHIATPNFSIVCEWTILQVLAYVKSWSAYRLAVEVPEQAVLLKKHEIRMLDSYDNSQLFTMKAPLTLVAGRIAK